jgi:hypothetical protein
MVCYNTRPSWHFLLLQQLHGGIYTMFINHLDLGDSFGVHVLLTFDLCFVTSLQIIILQSYTIRLGKK